MSRTAPPPPKTPKAAATRERLLEVAHRLFIDEGYDAVALVDIAEAAGLTKGAIYGHFRSKGQLLVEVIRAELAAQDATVDAGTDDRFALVEQFVDEATTELRLLQVDAAAAARHDDDVAEGLAELLAERQRWIEDLTDDGSTASAELRAFAFVVAALAGGVGMQQAAGVALPDRRHFARIVDRMIAAAMDPDARS